MSLFVDTSVWSLALRRDRPADVPEVGALERALAGGELVMTTGLVYQELLQGFHGPRDQEAIVARFGALTDLSLENCPIGGGALRHLAGLSKLEWLNLWSTKVDDAGLQHLSGLRNLELLPIGGTRVTDVAFV